jgi:hypothetical protein
MAKTTNTRFPILCKPLECGAGGGNRTIRAYSFYVTYCKHTNARTAQPAVCPPPMYKIMYNKSDGVRPAQTWLWNQRNFLRWSQVWTHLNQPSGVVLLRDSLLRCELSCELLEKCRMDSGRRSARACQAGALLPTRLLIETSDFSARRRFGKPPALVLAARFLSQVDCFPRAFITSVPPSSTCTALVDPHML